MAMSDSDPPEKERSSNSLAQLSCLVDHFLQCENCTTDVFDGLLHPSFISALRSTHSKRNSCSCSEGRSMSIDIRDSITASQDYMQEASLGKDLHDGGYLAGDEDDPGVKATLQTSSGEELLDDVQEPDVQEPDVQEPESAEGVEEERAKDPFPYDTFSNLTADNILLFGHKVDQSDKLVAEEKGNQLDFTDLLGNIDLKVVQSYHHNTPIHYKVRCVYFVCSSSVSYHS